MQYYFNICAIGVIVFLIVFFFQQYVLIGVILTLIFVGIVLNTVPAHDVEYVIKQKVYPTSEVGCCLLKACSAFCYNLPMIKAILLDLGDVLTENREDYNGPAGNLQINPETWHKAGLGLIEDDVAFQEMAGNHNVDVATKKDWLFAKRKPNQAVLDVLAKLKPGIKKAIISNSLKTIFADFITRYGLEDRFDALVISSEEQVKKPDAKIFLRTCKKLAIDPSECLFIDNDVEHIEAAKRLGMNVFWFTSAVDLQEEFSKLQLIV